MISPSVAFLLLAGSPHGFSPQALWDEWPAARFVTTPAPCLRHAELVERLRALESLYRGRLALEEVGRSVLGREVHLVTVGSGPRRALLWSQMHGDEPSATPALLDIAALLLGSGAPEARAILERFTLLMVPMLNPDGAERYARRNAQGIDINRDALALATPEGRLLKAVRDRFQPELGFNLHDQNRRTTVGDTSVLATISLLAVSGDAQGTVTPGRARAKRVCSAIARALGPFVPGGIGRYDEDWNPRAFGDKVTAWGTPVVLIESGGVAPGRPLADLTRLNYVALLTALHRLAGDDLAGETPDLYESLPRNEENGWTDVLVAGGRVWQPGAGEPYRADVAFDVLDDDPLAARCREPGWPGASRIREVGDGRLLGAARRVEASGRLLVPAFTASVRGLEARAWLDATTATAMGRLGVARLLWRVAPASRPDALLHAGSVAAPGRPAIEVVDAAAPPGLLEVASPPGAAPSAS
ncbi:MAG TPA: M14 family zinc carboxypeptidase, partial [Vicinamibacteria bacterium]